MAIQQFGESLLTDIRKRKEDERRRLQKQQERDAFLGLGVGLAAKIGNEMLANKAVDFFKQEPVWNAGLAQKKARTYSADILNIESQMSEQGGEMGWTLKNMDPQFEAYLQRNLPDAATGKAGIYEEWKEQRKQEMAQDWLDNEYRPALELARKVSSADDYEAMVALNAKKAAPSNLGAFITRAGANFLGGKSQQEIDVEAIDAITSGRMAQNAEKLNTFMQSYRTTGDVVRAFDIAETVFPEQELSEDEKFNINRTQKLTEVNNQLIVYEEVEKTEINTGEKTTDIGDGITNKTRKPKILFAPGSNNDETKIDIMKGLNSSFNFSDKGRVMLERPAFVRFVAEATEAGHNVQAPTSLKEHQAIQTIFRKYITEENLRDDFAEKKTLKAFDLMVGDPEEMLNMLSSVLAETDPVKRNEGLEQLGLIIVQKMGYAEQLMRGNTLDYRETSND